MNATLISNFMVHLLHWINPIALFLVHTYYIGCIPITLFSVHTYYISLTPNYTDFSSILHFITYIQPPITLFRITLSFKNTVYSVFRGFAVFGWVTVKSLLLLLIDAFSSLNGLEKPLRS